MRDVTNVFCRNAAHENKPTKETYIHESRPTKQTYINVVKLYT